MSLEDAFHHPRIDVSGGEAVIADDSLPADTLAALAQAGPVTTTRRVPYPYAFACPAGVLREGQENWGRSEEHTSELQSLMPTSYAVFCLKKKKKTTEKTK